MCQAHVTVVHCIYRQDYISRNLRTEQCYTAYLLRARICAPGPPHHIKLSLRFPPGMAAQQKGALWQSEAAPDTFLGAETAAGFLPCNAVCRDELAV